MGAYLFVIALREVESKKNEKESPKALPITTLATCTWPFCLVFQKQV
jgi:hypothetical protein